MLTYRVFLITKALLLRLLQRQPRMELKRVLRRKGFCFVLLFLARFNQIERMRKWKKKYLQKAMKMCRNFLNFSLYDLDLDFTIPYFGLWCFCNFPLFGLLYKFDFNIFLPYFAINLGAKRCSGYFHWTSLSDTNWKKKLTGCHHILT